MLAVASFNSLLCDEALVMEGKVRAQLIMETLSCRNIDNKIKKNLQRSVIRLIE